MTDPKETPDEHLWEVGWDGHERAQRRRMANLTLRQKIEWLEEAQKIAENLAAARRRLEDQKP